MKKSEQTEKTEKNEVCTNKVCTPHQRCTFFAVGKSENELLALDESNSKGDGNYFTDDLNFCNRYSFSFYADRAIEEYEKANKIKLKDFNVTITKTGKKYNVEIVEKTVYNKKPEVIQKNKEQTDEKIDKNKKQITTKETEIRICQFYTIGKSKKELIAYDDSYGGEGNYYTEDIFLCRRYNRDEAFITALERKFKFFLVKITKTDGKYKKDISEMEIPAEPPVGTLSQWNHSCAIGGLYERLSDEELKSLIKALKKHPVFKREYFSSEKTSITKSQYSFLSDFEHYSASGRSGVPGHSHNNDFFARLNNNNWEIYDCVFENIYQHCRKYFIINYNTVRQYVRFVLEWNWGQHLYYIKETLNEGYISKKVRPEIQKIINKWYRPMEVTINKDGSFDISCAATCKDKIYHLDVNVDKTGALAIYRVETLARDVYEIDNSDW